LGVTFWDSVLVYVAVESARANDVYRLGLCHVADRLISTLIKQVAFKQQVTQTNYKPETRKRCHFKNVGIHCDVPYRQSPNVDPVLTSGE